MCCWSSSYVVLLYWIIRTAIQLDHFCWRINSQMLYFWLKKKLKGNRFFVIPPTPQLMHPLNGAAVERQKARAELCLSHMPVLHRLTSHYLKWVSQITTQHNLLGGAIRFPPPNISPLAQPSRTHWSEANVTNWKQPCLYPWISLSNTVEVSGALTA